jgi:hypothetical protein
MRAESGKRRARCRTAGILRIAGSRRVVDSQPLSNPQSAIPHRSAITLMEVLISMFVLLFGLMGVAAIFPVGNHYVVEGEKYDQGSILAQNAFEELEARGMLRPERWLYASYPAPDIPRLLGPEFIVQPPGDSSIGSVPGKFNFPGIGNVAAGPGNLPDPGYAFVIDPMSVAAGVTPPSWLYQWPMAFRTDGVTGVKRQNAWNYSTNPAYPAAGRQLLGAWPVRRMTLPIPDASGRYSYIPMTQDVAETIFRLRDDLAVSLPDRDDAPAMQLWQTADVRNTPNDPTDDLPLTRKYLGNFSWLATIVPQTLEARDGLQPAERKGQLYDVSVVVFYKRDPTPSAESERMIEAEMQGVGELVLFDPGNDPTVVDAAVKDIKAGDWIAVMGVNQTSGTFMLKWYRILALDEDTYTDYVNTTDSNLPMRRAMVTGPDWPKTPDPSLTPPFLPYIGNLQAAILPGVASVVTREMVMEGESLWSGK